MALKNISAIQALSTDNVQLDPNPAYAVTGELRIEHNVAYQAITINPGGGGRIATISPPGPSDTLQPPPHDEVEIDPNPAYDVAGKIKMEDNQAYQTTITGGGAGSGSSYYEDIIDATNLKMTENPAYAVS